MRKQFSYLHDKPSRTALEHRAHCQTIGADDRVACKTCAGFQLEERSKQRYDETTRQRLGYEISVQGRCPWIYGALDPDRLHRCDSFLPITEHSKRVSGLRDAIGGKAQYTNHAHAHGGGAGDEI